MLRRLRPNIDWVRAVVCPAVVFIAMGLDRGYQTDFWHHLARGREIARAGRLPDVDQFTFTVAGQAVRDANWLTQLGYYHLFTLGGMPLVQFANALVLAAAAGLLVWVCRRRSASVAVGAAAGVLAFAGIWQTLLVRPQSLSLLLFVALLAVLLEAERRRWLLLVPPLLMALWANLHGGFPIGLVLIGAFAAATLLEGWSVDLRRRLFGAPLPVSGVGEGDQPLAVRNPAGETNGPVSGWPLRLHNRDKTVRRLLACLAGSVVATCLNPYGPRVYEYVLTLSKRASGRHIEEWLPPSMDLWVGRALVASVVLLIVLLAVARRRPRPRDLFVALAFLPLACASVRMVPWWLLAVSPVLASTIGANLVLARARRRNQPRPSVGMMGEREPGLSVPAVVMLALVSGAVVLSVPGLERYNPIFGTLRPTRRPEADLEAVVARLAERSDDARVFTRLEWGEYLDWAAYPRGGRTFIDGRIEIYPDDVWQQYHAVTSARADWQGILDGRGVDYLLLDSTYHVELLPHVRASGQWERVCGAGPAVLYTRTGAAAGAGVAAADIHDAR